VFGSSFLRQCLASRNISAGSGKPSFGIRTDHDGFDFCVFIRCDLFQKDLTIVPDFERYPKYGRDLDFTSGEIGLSGHWIKILFHHLFLYKARLRPGWSLIPE
jgi:hypothetical protein